MNTDTPVIEINHLVRKYGKADAVNDLSLRVAPGRCYGFFGRNGAGKTTTIKCLLNLLRPTSGQIRVFGFDPQKDEVAVKSRLAYVPDYVAFYPWMTVRSTLDYLASFRQKVEPPNGEGFARTIPIGRHQKNQRALQGAENATGAHRRRLRGAGVAGVAGRADFRAGPDCAARIHPGCNRRLPGNGPGAADGVRFHASHHGVRGID